MKNRKMYLLNMTKSELAQLLSKNNNTNNKKIIRLHTISNKLKTIFFCDMIFIGLGMLFNTSFTVFVGVCVGLVLTIHNMIINSIEKKVHKSNDDIKYQLDNLITLDYEKKRYALEKKHEKNNDISINQLILNAEEKINLLKQYKEELTKYNIDNNEDEINCEMAIQHYSIHNLHNIQKTKK